MRGGVPSFKPSTNLNYLPKKKPRHREAFNIKSNIKNYATASTTVGSILTQRLLLGPFTPNTTAPVFKA